MIELKYTMKSAKSSTVFDNTQQAVYSVNNNHPLYDVTLHINAAGTEILPDKDDIIQAINIDCYHSDTDKWLDARYAIISWDSINGAELLIQRVPYDLVEWLTANQTLSDDDYIL